MTSGTDNLFGETAFNNSKVKFGAPHVVDFGRELEHSPDGKMYICGHGASLPQAHQSWMQGDEVYLARVTPTVEAINDVAQWEFFGGKVGQWNGTDDLWVKGNVRQAKPILTWHAHTGVTTMTWVPALKKFITCISTPSFTPYTTKQFDTYFLESDSMTGPFKLVHYMREFGPEAYFVNIPSSFMDRTPKLTVGAGPSASVTAFNAFLSYSANFAFAGNSTPAGSGYHWVLQQFRFALGGRYAGGSR